MLPARIPKPKKRATRWRSVAHCNFVRGHACSKCGSTIHIQAAHVRLRGGAGMGQKPDDWRTVSLCAGGGHEGGCHSLQHRMGEESFWKGIDVEALIAEFNRASPKRHEIEAIQRERANG